MIIAEAGVNHNGDIQLAKKLIDVAADAGADYVKFQTFKTEQLVSPDAKQAEYQKRNLKSEEGSSQFEMLKKLELSEEAHHELIKYCYERKIKFLSTAFDMESLEFLIKLKPSLYKIPSGEITNLPYIKRIGSLKKEVILSTGMSTMKEIGDAVKVLIKAGTSKQKITVLHCNTDYPTKFSDVNLNAMQTISKKLKVKIGYSDHTLGIEVPIAAVALGAVVIEKHFTLDRALPGPDQAASLEPNELKQMVTSIRNIEAALGSDVKTPTASEKKNIVIARKSIHLAKEVKKGKRILENDLIMKRPGDGISPMEIAKVVGKIVKSDLNVNHKLKWSNLK